MSVGFGSHATAAAPGFVSDAPYLDVIRLLVTVCFAHFRKGSGACGGVNIIHPLADVHGSGGGDVGSNVRLCFGELAETKEFVGAYLICFVSAVIFCPPVNACRTLVARADTVAPVVGFGKAAARPTYHGDLRLLDLLDDLGSEALGVGNA